MAKSQNNIEKIADCLSQIEGLAHLDLSFNYFTNKEGVILNQGLIENHELLGIHCLGNEFLIDSQGFLFPNPAGISLEESHFFNRIFSNTKNPKKNLKTHCWLCEG